MDVVPNFAAASKFGSRKLCFLTWQLSLTEKRIIGSFPLEDAILILKLLANQIPFLTLHNFMQVGVNIASYKGF